MAYLAVTAVTFFVFTDLITDIWEPQGSLPRCYPFHIFETTLPKMLLCPMLAGDLILNASLILKVSIFRNVIVGLISHKNYRKFVEFSMTT
jgi:hypothetical protein